MIVPSKVFKFSELIDFSQNQIVSKILASIDGGLISIFSFAENESVSEQSNSEDIFIFVLEGDMSVEYKGKTYHAGTQEMIAIPRNTLHQVSSLSKSKVLQLSLQIGKEETNMAGFINKIEQGEILNLSDVVDYQEGGISSLAMVQRKDLTITIMAFDKGQKIASHSSTGDAMVQILDGSVSINIGSETYELSCGQSIVMPAGVAHSLTSVTKFKMMLTVVKPQEEIS